MGNKGQQLPEWGTPTSRSSELKSCLGTSDSLILCQQEVGQLVKPGEVGWSVSSKRVLQSDYKIQPTVVQSNQLWCYATTQSNQLWCSWSIKPGGIEMPPMIAAAAMKISILLSKTICEWQKGLQKSIGYGHLGQTWHYKSINVWFLERIHLPYIISNHWDVVLCCYKFILS